MIKGKSPEEIRSTFNIDNDFTPEEESRVLRFFTYFTFGFVRRTNGKLRHSILYLIVFVCS